MCVCVQPGQWPPVLHASWPLASPTCTQQAAASRVPSFSALGQVQEETGLELGADVHFAYAVNSVFPSGAHYGGRGCSLGASLQAASHQSLAVLSAKLLGSQPPWWQQHAANSRR